MPNPSAWICARYVRGAFFAPGSRTVRPGQNNLRFGTPGNPSNLRFGTPGNPSGTPALHAQVESRWHVANTIDTHDLETQLDAQAYALTQTHDACVIAVDSFAPKTASEVVVRRIVDERGLRDCWKIATEAFGTARNYTDDDAAFELEQCCAANSRIQRFVAYLHDRPVCSGGMSSFPSLGFALLWAGGTVPDARGRGAYSAVVAARIERAAQLDIPFVGLYAREDSSSPIVGAQGFENVGRMSYWVRNCRP